MKHIYLNTELQDKEIRDKLLNSLIKDNQYREDISATFDDCLFDGGDDYPYYLNIGEGSFFYANKKDVLFDLRTLMNEWKNQPLYVDYHDKTDQTLNADTWLDCNHNALKHKK
jgi:hypothetical protein